MNMEKDIKCLQLLIFLKKFYLHYGLQVNVVLINIYTFIFNVISKTEKKIGELSPLLIIFVSSPAFQTQTIRNVQLLVVIGKVSRRKETSILILHSAKVTAFSWIN